MHFFSLAEKKLKIMLIFHICIVVIAYNWIDSEPHKNFDHEMTLLNWKHLALCVFYLKINQNKCFKRISFLFFQLLFFFVRTYMLICCKVKNKIRFHVRRKSVNFSFRNFCRLTKSGDRNLFDFGCCVCLCDNKHLLSLLTF